jgi:hypothetical protein
VSVGTVTTGAAGSSVAITNAGSSTAAVFDFTIPRGDTGAAGQNIELQSTTAHVQWRVVGETAWSNLLALSSLAGPTGPAGPANTLVIGAVASGTTASAVIAGTAPNQTLDLILPRGEVGPAGPANTLTIDSVTTGAAGSSASATIAGTAPNQTLSLTIPRGDVGPTGATGSQGPAGDAASVTVGTVTTGAAGSSVSVTNSGSPSAAVLDFAIPRGDTGTDGREVELQASATHVQWRYAGSTAWSNLVPLSEIRGPQGPTTITVGTVTTGAAGSSASVTNSGSGSDLVLDFTIPRGDTGAAGVSLGLVLALS